MSVNVSSTVIHTNITMSDHKQLILELTEVLEKFKAEATAIFERIGNQDAKLQREIKKVA